MEEYSSPRGMHLVLTNATRNQKEEQIFYLNLHEVSRAVKSWHRMLDDGNDKKYCTTRKEFQFGKIEKKLLTCGTVAV